MPGSSIVMLVSVESAVTVKGTITIFCCCANVIKDKVRSIRILVFEMKFIWFFNNTGIVSSYLNRKPL